MIKSIARRGSFSVKRYERAVAGPVFHTNIYLYKQTILTLTRFFRWSSGTCTRLPQLCPTFTRLGSFTGKINSTFSCLYW